MFRELKESDIFETKKEMLILEKNREFSRKYHVFLG